MATAALRGKRRAALSDATRQPAPLKWKPFQEKEKPQQRISSKRLPAHAERLLAKRLQSEQLCFELVALVVSDGAQFASSAAVEQRRLDQADRRHHTHRTAQATLHGSAICFQDIQLQLDNNQAESGEFVCYKRCGNAHN